MLEQFLPLETPDRSNGAKKQQARAPVADDSTSAWPAAVGVTRVSWHAGGGLGAAPLLASSTASGICRIDWLVGRWLQNRIPYSSIQAMRMEEGESELDELDADDDGW
jgi:transcription factor C subunit 6